MRYPVCKHKSHARRESFVGVREHECLSVYERSRAFSRCLEQDLQDF